MTIECIDTYLFGLINKKREVKPGTKEPLDTIPLFSEPGKIFSSTLYVDSEDSCIIRKHGVHHKDERDPVVRSEQRLIKDQINVEPIIGLRGVSALFGTAHIYSWKPRTKE